MKQTISNDDFIKLAEKRLQNSATKEEQRRFDEAYHLLQSRYPEWDLAAMREERQVKAEIYTAMLNNLAHLENAKPKKLWPGFAAAASIAAAVATIVFGVWFFAYRSSDTGDSVQTGIYATDIKPGKNGATISLSTGEVIQLDSTKRGVKIDPASVTYDDGSSLEEKSSSGTGRSGFSLQTETVVQMTAQTAKGQTYEFTLPDGTHVFLNAESKIIFPSQFSGKERRILLEGEAYFAVTHNAKQPFRVESRGSAGRSQLVEDIGTEFNISAYPDDSSVKTTLVEGSASVMALAAGGGAAEGGARKILSPKQQANLYNGKLSVQTVDPEEVVDWKNGEFIFENEELGSIMRKIARWYDVTLIYEPGLDLRQTFGGKVSRSKNVSAVLTSMQSTGRVKFKIGGKTITVLK